ncbi:MAG TPA: MBL fold metallo-hydrolase [Balneolaceae bacterium]|nr:MBL fold metallo-hydrolase [Balneolaceae bacterium]
MKRVAAIFLMFLVSGSEYPSSQPDGQFITVLGIAQDAGFPQADCDKEHCRQYWNGTVDKRLVVSLGLTDAATGQNWIFEATPDFPEQLHALKTESGIENLSGIFLTHAHIGHYTGLMYLGRESMGASNIPVYAMPQMSGFLNANGPWSQLVSQQNIAVNRLTADSTVKLTDHVSVTPFLVPHRDEFSETVGYRIESAVKKVLFMPDIDKWHVWDKNISEQIRAVDAAFLDATFFSADELPGRDMAEIPHPYVEESLEQFSDLPASEKKKIIFIHFNHTNPLILDSPEREYVEKLGYRVASEGDMISLN